MALERIVVGTSVPESAHHVEPMKGYAAELMEYSARNGVAIRFASVQPDHLRVVLTVKDEASKKRLQDAFRADPAYRADKGMAGQQRTYRREGPAKRYEVGISVTAPVTPA